ncbi:MAG: amino acid permease [Desulfobacterales bacterium]|nr:amino acid permease [Desulfobacterales bacterium]MDD4394047.1 amino acid permease [Desulfobacterales bacterium]
MSQTNSNQGGGHLGTFAGVFTPSILTILGIILFLRLGFVVGNAGIAKALVIIGMANAISILTSISLSAISTNLKVKGGGDYYLISRTLGPEFGGAIGIVLFLAQSVSIAFYCIGFGEAIAGALPQNTLFSVRIIAVMAMAFLFVFAWLGADWATKFQFIVMAILSAALVSFFIGGALRWDSALVLKNWNAPSGGLGFWTLFAIFFPAVTGFTQGVSMSGDLKDPGKSLPRGTFAAVGISSIIYFGAAILFSAVLPTSDLARDYYAMQRVAGIGFLVQAGVIAATLSSAMASFLGAPRILQSLAGDRIFPFLTPFSHGAGPGNNPRRGALLSLAIGIATIGMGNLNVVASVVSMFFLISYGLLNYATFYEARAASPSFRPRFRFFDYRLSFLGFLACLGAMLAIDISAGIAAIAVLFAIYQYLRRTAGPARWADSRRSYYLKNIRENLLAVSTEPAHPRDWRPHLLAFSDDSHRRDQLLRFSSWIQGNSGFVTAVRILEGEGVKMLKLRNEAAAQLQADIAANKIEAFALVLATPSLEIAIHTLIQSFGIGPLKANTLLINWLERPQTGAPEPTSYIRNLRTALRFGCNIMILDAKEDIWKALEALPSEKRIIDIWWWGDATSRLMLLLAYLMTRNEKWENAKIRLLAAGGDSEADRSIEGVESILEEARIDAEAHVVEEANADKIAIYSANSAMVFLPFRIRYNRLIDPFKDPLDELLNRLPLTTCVLAAEDIDLDAEPEEGTAGETAAAQDALADAEKKTEKLQKTAKKSSDLADEKRQEFDLTAASNPDEPALKKMETEVKEAEQEAQTEAKRAAKALAKAKQAAIELEKLGVAPKKPDNESQTQTNKE